jgi:tetrahedral aminopeptidase
MEAKKDILQNLPVLGAEQIALLERLSNASGVSGEEGAVRAIVLEQVTSVADSVKVDALGNVIAHRAANSDSAVRVMMAAHMDEVGFMISADDGEGLFQFQIVGGVDIRQLPGKKVLVGKERIPGVIGARAIHLIKNEEMNTAIPLSTLRIDVGPGDAAKKVQPGDRAVFDTCFMQTGPSLRGKALDNRLGVATLIALLKAAPANIDLWMVFTTQEEIGARGAKVAAYAVHPDLAIAVDSTPANDLPAWDGSENTRYNARLGFGPAIYPFDRGTISDPRLVAYMMQTGEAYGVPFQIRQPGGGGTDASVIHREREGIPSISVSVPGRYAHTAILLARLEDWQNTVRLLYAALAGLSRDVLAE